MELCPRCNAKTPQGVAACQKCGAPIGHGTLHPGADVLAQRPRVSLRIVRADGGPETLVPMTGNQLICGRKGDVVLSDDPFVAETQARFFFSAGRLAVEDVGGGNGVFLRIRQEREIPPDSELRVGRQRLQVEAISPPTAQGGVMQWGSSDGGQRFRLVQILEGDRRGSAYVLKDGENALGRETGDLTFPGDGFVSGRHAVLIVRESRLSIRDLGSSNGTFVRLVGASRVEDGDQYLIGRQLVRLDVKPAP